MNYLLEKAKPMWHSYILHFTGDFIKSLFYAIVSVIKIGHTIARSTLYTVQKVYC